MAAEGNAARADTTPPTQQFLLDNVALTISSKDLPSTAFGFLPAAAGDPDQTATDATTSPFVSLSVTTVPFGYGLAGNETLSDAETGGAATWQQTIATQSAQGAALTTGPTISVFGQQVTGTASQPSLALDGTTPVPVDEITWVAEAGGRMWIISAAEDHSIGTADFVGDLTVSSSNPDAATTLGDATPQDPGGVPVVPSEMLDSSATGSAGAAGATPAAAGVASSAFSTPSWWSGDCDANRAQGEAEIASYFGFEACGRFTNGRSAGTVAHIQYPGGGPTVSEFQCAELATRWAFLAWGISPLANANGGVWARVYSGHSTKTGGTLALYTDAAGPSHMPVAGDVMSMGTTYAHNGVGHVALVTSADIDANGNGTVGLMDQNYHLNGTFSISVKNWKIPNAGSSLVGTAWVHDSANGSAVPAPPAPTGPSLTVHNVTNPASGTLNLTVSSTQPLASEYYWLDGSVVAGTGVGPTGSATNLSGGNGYAWSLDTTHLRNGVHTIRATGTNGSGLAGDSGAVISFTVNNIVPARTFGGSTVVAPNGTVATFAIGLDNNLYTDNQTTPTSAFAGWVNVSGGVQVAGHPSVVVASNGTIATFERTASGQIETIGQTIAGGPYNIHNQVAAGGPASFVSDPTAVVAPNGTVAVFAVGNDQNLYTTNQTGPAGPFINWVNVSGGVQVAGHPSVVVASNGTIATFERTAAGQIETIGQTIAGGPYNIHNQLAPGGPGSFNGDPTAVIAPNGTVAAFAVGNDQNLYTTNQTGPASPFINWVNVSGGVQVAGHPSVVVASNGTIATFERTAAGQIETIGQAIAGGPYNIHNQVAPGGPGSFTDDPSTVVAVNNTLVLFASGSDNNLYETNQTNPASSFVRWNGMPGAAVGSIPAVAQQGRSATVAVNGTLVTFAVRNGGLWGANQSSPTSAIGSWWQVPGSANLVGTPVAVRSPFGGGTINVFARTTGGQIATFSQTGPAGGFVSSSIVGGLGAPAMAGDPAVVEAANGTIVVSAIDAAGNLWATNQNQPGSNYVAWYQVSGATGLRGTPSAILSPFNGGTVNLFAKTTGGQIAFASQSDPTSGISAPTNPIVGGWGAPSVAGGPGVVIAASGTIVVSAIDAAGNLWATNQNQPGSNYIAWYQVPGATGLTGTPSAILSPGASSLVNVFARTTAGQTAFYAQANPASGISQTVSGNIVGGLGAPNMALASNPTTTLGAGGTMVVFATDNNGVQWWANQVLPAGNYTAWTALP